MMSRGSRRTCITADGADIKGRSHRARVILLTALALAALALLTAAISEARSLFAGVQYSPASTHTLAQGQVTTFTRVQALADPRLDALGQSHHWGDPASPWQAQPISPSDVMTNNWTNVFPILYAINTVSTSEAWAVGEYGHVVHYSGGAWANVDPASMVGLSLTDVKFLSPSDGYIAGGTHVFHYDGTYWTDMSNGLGTSLRVGRVFPLTDNNIWGVGTHCTGQCFDTVVHWDGSTWTPVGPTFTFSTFFTDIAMPSANDGWVVASDINSNTPYVLHYDGASWTQFSTPPGAITLLKVSAPAVGDPWVISGYNNNTHHIYHYSNGSWTNWQVPGNIEPYGISMLSDTQGYVGTGNSIASWDGSTWTTEFSGRWLYDVSAISGRVWAAGRAETILMREVGPVWTMQRGGPTRYFMFAVSALPSGDAWAVGQSGTVVRYTNGAWSPFTTTLTADLFGVQMLSPNEVYIVGDHIIARCDSASCTQVATPTATLSSVYMTGSDQGWAVGTDGSIWQDSGGTWSSVTSPTALPLYFVTMDSPSHGWAGGGSSQGTFQPMLLEYDGTNWIDRTSTLPDGAPVLYSLALDPGGASGWAAGSKDFNNPQSNAFMRYTNNTWTVDHTSQAGSVFNVALDSNEQAVAIAGEIVGGVGVVAYHYYGGIWHQEAIPTEWCCQAGLSLVPGVGGWSVGPLGNIMRYTSPAGPPNTPTPTSTSTSTAVSTTDTPVPSTATPSSTSTPQPIPTACTLTFSDVPQGSTFYPYIHCLACLGIVSGYDDGTFRPGNNVTRGQAAKILSNSAGYQDPIPPGRQTFEDVAPGTTFWLYIERVALHGAISGYQCGQPPAGPCVPPLNRPYFLPANNMTRGQLAKIDSNAKGYNDEIPSSQQTFEDVPPDNTFWLYIERVYLHGVINGYQCGQPPAGQCVPPLNRPYFLPFNNVTRGQAAKIVSNTFFPDCSLR